MNRLETQTCLKPLLLLLALFLCIEVAAWLLVVIAVCSSNYNKKNKNVSQAKLINNELTWSSRHVCILSPYCCCWHGLMRSGGGMAACRHHSL